MDKSNMQEAINYFKSGDRAMARQILLDIVRSESGNEIAWLWLAACLDNPKQRRDCLHKVLSISPNNQNAQRALAELELQTLVDAPPVVKTGAVLKCPSCGSVLGSPDHTGVVQCKYCGTAITYHPPAVKVDSLNVERFLELCKSAIDAGNYEDAFQYANKALEIDPRNFNGWVYKAVAAFWQTTVANNRYAEAMEYLQKAEKIESENPLVAETRITLSKSQNGWYQHLGEEQVKLGREIFEIYATQYDLTGLVTDALLGNPDARAHSQEYFAKAMDYFLLASYYDPENYYTLYSIRNLANLAKWIKWTSAVNDRLSLLQKMEQRDNATSSLPDLRQQLSDAQRTLTKLKKEGGLFSGMKIDNTKKKIRALNDQIARLERIANADVE